MDAAPRSMNFLEKVREMLRVVVRAAGYLERQRILLTD